MNALKSWGIFVGFIILLVLYSVFYTVSEGQQGLLLRLGKLVDDPQTNQPMVVMPGLHEKLPFIVDVRRFDTRLQTLDVDQQSVLTAEQKYVLVDYFVKWRIQDLPLYYKRTDGNPFRAQVLLQQKINDALRAAFGKRTISEVVSGERLDIMRLLKSKAQQSASGLGITIVDVRIRGIELPKEVRESVFQRMSAEREQVATKHRAQGRAQAEMIRAGADAKVTVMIAKTKAEAANIRATGQQAAAMLYAKTYNTDPDFYAFYRSMLAYKTVFAKNHSVMLLSPKTAFFKAFNRVGLLNKKH